MIHWLGKRRYQQTGSASWTAAALFLLLGLFGCRTQPAGLLRPNGVALAPDGSLYVMDRGNYRVAHLSAQGQLLDSFGQLGLGPGDIFGGWDIELDTAGNIYICNINTGDEGFARSHDGVKVFTPEGQFLRELGGIDYGEDDSQAQIPYGLDIDSQGRIFVGGFDSNLLRVFNPDGQQVAELFGEKGAEDGQFNGLVDVAVDDQRHLLYATDQFNSRVQQFQLAETETGEITASHRLSFGEYGREAGQFAYPQDVIVDDKSGRVYVSDMGNRRIQVFDPEGRYLTEISAPMDWQVIGMDLGPDGALYAADARNNLIWVFEPDGRVRQRLEAGS